MAPCLLASCLKAAKLLCLSSSVGKRRGAKLRPLQTGILQPPGWQPTRLREMLLHGRVHTVLRLHMDLSECRRCVFFLFLKRCSRPFSTPNFKVESTAAAFLQRSTKSGTCHCCRKSRAFLWLPSKSSKCGCRQFLEQSQIKLQFFVKCNLELFWTKKKKKRKATTCLRSSLDIKKIKFSESTWLSKVNYQFFQNQTKFRSLWQ